MLPTTADLNTLILKNADPIRFFKTDNVFQDELVKIPKELQGQYDYNPESRNYTLREEEWLKWRTHGPFWRHPEHPRYVDVAIGGSDIAALFDGSELSKRLFLYEGQHGSPYKTAIELFYEKTGQTLPLQEKKTEDIFWVGHNEEASIRNLFKKLYKKDHPADTVEVFNDTYMYQCGIKKKDGSLQYPYCLLNCDGIVVINGLAGILECKTCNFTSEDYQLWKNGICPLKYYLQVCWYMAGLNLPYAYIICKWGLQPQDCTYIYIERNLEIEKSLFVMADEFVSCVRTGKEPSVEGQDIERLYTFWRKKMGNFVPKAPVVELPVKKKLAITKIATLNKEEEAIKERLEEIEIERETILVKDIFPVFGDSNIGSVQLSEDEVCYIKLRTKGRFPGIDTDKLKAEKPEIYDMYVSLEPKFNTSLFRKEQKIILEDYMKEDTSLTETKRNYCELEVKKMTL